jgi:hypothetical protein
MYTYRLTNEKMKLIVKNWQLIADKYNGKFRNILAKSPAVIDPVNNKIRRFELHIPVLGENMIFRTSENHHFKLDCKFKNKLDFEIQIHPEDYVEKISKLFGMKEIEVGNPKFDNKYIIKGTDHKYVKLLLDKTVQDFMIKFNFYTFQLKTDTNSELMIMPFIREQQINELEEFILKIINFAAIN